MVGMAPRGVPKLLRILVAAKEPDGTLYQGAVLIARVVPTASTVNARDRADTPPPSSA